MILVMIYYPGGFSGFYDWARAKIVTSISKRKDQRGEV
jgi:hypothetical protein